MTHCKLYDPENNFCNHFKKAGVPVDKVCPSCPHKVNPDQDQDVKDFDPEKCQRFIIEGEDFCFNHDAMIWRNRAVAGVCDVCTWPEGSTNCIYEEYGVTVIDRAEVIDIKTGR